MGFCLTVALLKQEKWVKPQKGWKVKNKGDIGCLKGNEDLWAFCLSKSPFFFFFLGN